MKTLIVKYTPREERSKTKKLLDTFFRCVPKDGEFQIVDLADDHPGVFTRDRLDAYYKRNYDNLILSPAEEKILKQMDLFTNQLLWADVLIIVSPVYNFGPPAPLKAWIDAVMQRGKVFLSTPNGKIGQLGHLKVLGLYVGGIVYSELYGTANWNTLDTLIRANFEWAGAKDVRMIGLEGVDMLPEKEISSQWKFVNSKIKNLIKTWYQKHN